MAESAKVSSTTDNDNHAEGSKYNILLMHLPINLSFDIPCLLMVY